MKVEELKTAKQMKSIYPILSHMYPEISQSEYENIIDERISEGYQMVAVFDGKKCVCAAGFWFGVRFYCGKFIQLDNMISIPQYRSKGVGKLITDWIKSIGKDEGCKRILVDTYVENFDAHKFFIREGFIIRGYHLNYQL